MNSTDVTRTNYFHVKDEASFLTLMSKVGTTDDKLHVWTQNDEHGNPVYGFGVFGAIEGLPIMPAGVEPGDFAVDEYDCDWDYGAFANELKELVADDDAIIILSSGYEGLRYIAGDATVITSKQVKYLDLRRLAFDTAVESLGNPDWNTMLDY